MAEITEERWATLERSHRTCTWPSKVASDLFTYAQSLRQENETLRLEFEGVDCEHRAKVMRTLREDNERLRRAVKRLGEYADMLPGGMDRTAFEALVNSVAAQQEQPEKPQGACTDCKLCQWNQVCPHSTVTKKS